jgi:hypothetical protein
MEVVREMFLEGAISLHGDLSWPARLHDLSSCDYFLWGYLKAKCTPVDNGPSMISRLQFGSKFQRYKKTWQGKHWET